MFIEQKTIKTNHTRTSKTGLVHYFYRNLTIVVLRCDSCQNQFHRPLGKMNKKRLSNQYYHVCQSCDSKRFAQAKGVERRRIWNLPADSDIDISKI